MEQKNEQKFNEFGQRNPNDPQRINVNGRWLTSYADYAIHVNLLTLRRWQIIIAPDSEGDTCEQILIPIGINGLRRKHRKGGNVLLLDLAARLTPMSFYMKRRKGQIVHYLTRLVYPDDRRDLVERGEADPSYYRSVSDNMGHMYRIGEKIPLQGNMRDGEQGIRGNYEDCVRTGGGGDE